MIDQCFSSRNIATAGDKAFAERTHPQIDLAGVDLSKFRRTKAATPKHTQGMRLIYHQPSPMAPRHRREGGEVGNVAIHAVMALDDNQRASRPRLAQRLVRGLRIVVRESQPPSARQSRAL